MQGAVINQPVLSYQFHFRDKDRHYIDARTLFSFEWGIILLTEELGKMLGVEVKTYVQARKEGSFISEVINMLPQAVDSIQNCISQEFFNYILSTIINEGCDDLFEYIEEQIGDLPSIDSTFLVWVLNYYKERAIERLGNNLYGLIFGNKVSENSPKESNTDNGTEVGYHSLKQLTKEEFLGQCAKLQTYARRIRNAMQKDDTITSLTISMKLSNGDVLTYEIKNSDNELPKLPK